jgi:hypothetical protein
VTAGPPRSFSPLSRVSFDASKPPVGIQIPRSPCEGRESWGIGRSPLRFALNDFALYFTLFPKALFTFRSHYFFAVGLGAPCLAFADGHLPVCTARSNCATLRRVSTVFDHSDEQSRSNRRPAARVIARDRNHAHGTVALLGRGFHRASSACPDGSKCDDCVMHCLCV